MGSHFSFDLFQQQIEIKTGIKFSTKQSLPHPIGDHCATDWRSPELRGPRKVNPGAEGILVTCKGRFTLHFPSVSPFLSLVEEVPHLSKGMARMPINLMLRGWKIPYSTH